MTELTWEQKFVALDALSHASMKLDTNKKWFVSHSRVERKEGGCLASSGGAHAETIEKAVNNYWGWLTCPAYTIVVNAYTDQRRSVKWNGFMWEGVTE